MARADDADIGAAAHLGLAAIAQHHDIGQAVAVSALFFPHPPPSPA